MRHYEKLPQPTASKSYGEEAHRIINPKEQRKK